jgi:fumarate hydratase, class II
VTEREYRTEHDSMGDVLVPIAAKWRAQTQRAVENFPVSGQRVEPALVHALAAIKRSAAAQNAELGVLPDDVAKAISAVASEVVPANGTRSSRSTSSRPGRARRRT